jgi:hypothetical protein
MQWRYRILHIFAVLGIVIFIVSRTIAQESHTEKRISLANGVGTITEHGEVGGESQDRYVLNIDAGRRVTIVLYSEQNKADFSICDERDGYGDSDVCQRAKTIRSKYSTRSKEVKYRKAMQWMGRIPKAGDYTISVIAYPGSASYTLQVKVE